MNIRRLQRIHFVNFPLQATLSLALLAPHHLVFTALEGALLDPRTDSFSGAEEALAELSRRRIPWVLLTRRTRAEIEPLRQKLGHEHPFVTENGGGIYVPDGYFNLRIPGGMRVGRYFCIALGRAYRQVCDALDEIAEECGVGVVGFHHLSAREIAENTGLRPRYAELAQAREFDELFYFTSAKDKAVARFVEAGRQRGFAVAPGPVFWRISADCDPGRAVRTLAQLYKQATRSRLRLVGIGAGAKDLPWLTAVDRGVLLPYLAEKPVGSSHGLEVQGHIATRAKIAIGESSGPAGWNSAMLNIIS